MNERYFMPFGHLKGNERDNAVFKENTKVRGNIMMDYDNNSWRILKESRWKHLYCPSSDQKLEETPCRYVAICDVVMARKQVNETKNRSGQYFSNVVGDKLSARHLYHLCDGGTGEELAKYLKKNPVTTRSEFSLKRIANLSSIKNVELHDMTGCTSHKISAHNTVVGDYQGEGEIVNEYKHDKFDELCEYLENVGPFYASIYTVNGKTKLLGQMGKYYNRTENDKLNETRHASMVIGYGVCWNASSGMRDNYFVIQNTWGETTTTKNGRMSNKVLAYGLQLDP